MWGRGGEGYGIIGLPFSPTPTAAALVQHRPTERGKAGAKLALKASPAPPFLSCVPSASLHSLPSPFDLSGHVRSVLAGMGGKPKEEGGSQRETSLSPLLNPGPAWPRHCTRRRLVWHTCTSNSGNTPATQQSTELSSKASQAHQVPFHCRQGEQEGARECK